MIIIQLVIPSLFLLFLLASHLPSLSDQGSPVWRLVVLLTYILLSCQTGMFKVYAGAA